MNERGIVLYFIIMILALSSIIVTALVSITTSQIKTFFSAGNATKAYFAAETGIEQALFKIRIEDNYEGIGPTFIPDNNSSYQVNIQETNSEIKLQGLGKFQNTQRVIEAQWQK